MATPLQPSALDACPGCTVVRNGPARMPNHSPKLQRHHATDLTLPQMRSLSALVHLAFPDPSCSLDARVAQLLALRARQPLTMFVVWDGETAIANASFFTREILTTSGLLPVMALAAVCSAPDRRGEGWGRRVVAAAFAEVDAGKVSVSLFQTGVPDFYRKLGARTVENLFLNTGELDPRPDHGTREQPWWSPHVMIYPAAYPWPEGPVDLRGPGY